MLRQYYPKLRIRATAQEFTTIKKRLLTASPATLGGVRRSRCLEEFDRDAVRLVTEEIHAIAAVQCLRNRCTEFIPFEVEEIAAQRNGIDSVL